MPISDAEISSLAATYDIISLGMTADEIRRARHGARTTFVRVATVPLEPDNGPVEPQSAGELRIVGRPSGRSGLAERVGEIAARAGGTPVSGFSLSDLEELATFDGITLRSLLEELSAAGLELIADAPFERLRDARRAIEEVNIAGLALARLTVHQLPSADVPAFLKRVAELQADVGVVRAFAPLPRTMNPALPTTGFDDVKRVALARVVVDNVPSIQVDWSLYGPKLAQVALTVGADDIDGISPFDESPSGRRRTPLAEILLNIRTAGLEPVERDGRFEPLAR